MGGGAPPPIFKEVQYEVRPSCSVAVCTPNYSRLGTVSRRAHCRGLLVSFTRWNVISSPQWQGLANYRELMSSEIFWRVLKNTVLFSVTYVPGVMVCGLFLAILVNTKLKGITFFRGLYYLPVITSTVAIGVVWSWILSPRFGALPRILNNLGVMNVPSFLGDSRYALLTLVVVYIWKMSGYHMILFLAGLQNIPEVYYEAAKIDGATPWQLLRHVTLPLLSTTTFFIMIIALIQSLQTFDLTFAMTEGGPTTPLNSQLLHLCECLRPFPHGLRGFHGICAVPHRRFHYPSQFLGEEVLGKYP